MRPLLIALIAATIAAPSFAADHPGAVVYRTKMCKACHGDDGSGNTPAGKTVQAHDLRSEAVQKKSDQELMATITNGKGKMPSFKSSLKAEQIRDVVGYIRTLKK